MATSTDLAGRVVDRQTLLALRGIVDAAIERARPDALTLGAVVAMPAYDRGRVHVLLPGGQWLLFRTEDRRALMKMLAVLQNKINQLQGAQPS